MNAARGAAAFDKRWSYWTRPREAARNWLALGLLLAAWNATDNENGRADTRRPDTLKTYAYVSVRAVQRLRARGP